MADIRTAPTAGGAEPSAPPERSRSSWRYPDDGGRDRRLDLLRGYALAAMSVNHFGLSQSYVHSVSGRSSFLISAAEAFLFISGFTLGFISFGRSVDTSTGRLRQRTWTVYLATIGITVGFGSVALLTHLELWGGFEAGGYDGVWQWLLDVVTLRTAFNGADILITYVLYLGVAVAAIRLLATGRTRVVVAATAGLYALSLLGGGDEGTFGFASFRALLPNAPLFFGGLVLGYHRADVAGLWRRVPRRGAIDVAVVVAAVVLGVIHAGGWTVWTSLGEAINGPDLTEPLGRREFQMPLLALAVVGLYLRALWIVVDSLWVPLRRALGWLLLPLGEASLFTFTMHLVAIPIMFNLPFWPEEDLGRPAATVWVVAYLVLIWVAVLGRQVVLRWLRSGGPRRAALRRHGPIGAVSALVAVALVASISPSGAAGTFGSEAGEFEDGGEVEEIIELVEEGELSVEEAIEILEEEGVPPAEAVELVEGATE
ncbi:MAG: OpgC domain-containing protein [Actinomycetota bacterium]